MRQKPCTKFYDCHIRQHENCFSAYDKQKHLFYVYPLLVLALIEYTYFYKLADYGFDKAVTLQRFS